jgi:hypothetical protein
MNTEVQVTIQREEFLRLSIGDQYRLIAALMSLQNIDAANRLQQWRFESISQASVDQNVEFPG